MPTYYFDGSDAAASDPNTVWTDDDNAFDSDSTPSTNARTQTSGSTSSNYLMAEGTNAPGSGDGIMSVYARIYGGNTEIAGSVTLSATIYTDNLGESLGTATVTRNAETTGWGSYQLLSTPSGGWSWTTLQALEVKCYANTNGSANGFRIYKIELLVDVSPPPTVNFYLRQGFQ